MTRSGEDPTPPRPTVNVTMSPCRPAPVGASIAAARSGSSSTVSRSCAPLQPSGRLLWITFHCSTRLIGSEDNAAAQSVTVFVSGQ